MSLMISIQLNFETGIGIYFTEKLITILEYHINGDIGNTTI